ncbi:MAG: preprotein translocase subunit TatB [Caulobacter sp.]|nr:preprotein translocase subunit TatB [Caulobacter sp.]
MLPDIGGTELLVIAAVALIVVGPKDLPVLLRKLGQFVGKIRGMAAEFRSSFDEMARQSELDDLRKEVEAMRSGQYTAPMHEAAAAAKDAGVDQVFADIDASLNSGAAQLHPPMSHQYENGELGRIGGATPAVELVETAKPRRKRATKDLSVEAAPAPRKRAAKAAVVEAPPAAKVPRKRSAKAAGSDLTS